MSGRPRPRVDPEDPRPAPRVNLQRIALVGQPNAGKSTLFNAIVGYRAVASNFPGTTVEALRGRAIVAGRPVEVVDLPGAYSLLAGDPAEEVTRRFLLSGEVDTVVQVADASLLGRSLELTLELAEIGIPMVLCLNMVDEAEHKGIATDKGKLSALLGVPVVATVASRGQGLTELLAALPAARPARRPPYSADVERALSMISGALGGNPDRLLRSPIHRAAHLLGGEGEEITLDPRIAAAVDEARSELSQGRGEDPGVILSDERHAQAARLFEGVATVAHARVGWREKLDDLLMHRLLGYPLLGLVLFALFWITFQVGRGLEGLLLPHLEGLSELAGQALGEGAWARVLVGALDGLWAGMGIVLPYLVPFYIVLALIEDVGYLPRVGFLLDGVMHRIGLHGKSVIPLLLGYGCSVPAVLATRMLDDDRDRLVTAALAVMVPCAARAIVVFGLVGKFVGPGPALGLFVLNAIVVGAAGAVLGRFLPGLGGGLILEIPPYRAPGVRTTLAKVWLRLREFVRVVWPLLVMSSAVLAVIEAFGWAGALDRGLRFITWPLGLPAEAGFPLVFGIFRKELTLVMLTQALRTENLAQVLSPGQIVVFTVFVLFYVPCLATVGALGREMGWNRTGVVLLGTTGVGLLLGVLARVVLIR